MMELQIELKHLNCKVGSQYLLHDINWQVHQGERWLIFGENGSGKTTLLSILAGYRQYQAESLKLFGEPYDVKRVLEYRQRIGWVSTSFFNQVLRNESVLSIVLSGKSGTLGISPGIINADVLRAKKLLEIFNIKQKKDNPYYMLSKGEQQSVLLARAFLAEPEMLFLDEPDSGLDFLARARLIEILTELVEQRPITVLYVTHYPEEIPAFMEHCMLLRDGVMYKKGTVEEMMCSSVLSDFLACPVEVERQNGRYHLKLQKKRGVGNGNIWRS
jgi:iron complex transport system ATP-binding protein